jgi:hypothetical protein
MKVFFVLAPTPTMLLLSILSTGTATFLRLSNSSIPQDVADRTTAAFAANIVTSLPSHVSLSTAIANTSIGRHRRHLHEEQPPRDFVPLSCNSQLQMTVGRVGGCQLWSQAVGTESVYPSRVTVPCGTCWILDLPSVTFADGLDVQGRLVLDGNKSRGPRDLGGGPAITIQTTLLVVQGRLEMTATTGPVRGYPDILISMVGHDDKTSFAPVWENSGACGDGSECLVGRKAIVVAGGSVNSTYHFLIFSSLVLEPRFFSSLFVSVVQCCSLSHSLVLSMNSYTCMGRFTFYTSVQGMPDHGPTWLRLYDVVMDDTNTYPTGVVVDSVVRDAWGVGAEILIASHTPAWDAHQVRSIVQVRDHDIAGYVELLLDSPIERPTTLLDSPDFAVEVALLSRNIVLDGGDDSFQDLQGGHFWFLNTVNVVQSLVGVEVKKFGQQVRFAAHVARHAHRPSHCFCLFRSGSPRPIPHPHPFLRQHEWVNCFPQYCPSVASTMCCRARDGPTVD